MTNIRIWATSDSPAALVLDDLGSKFRDSGIGRVKYDLNLVEVEEPIDAEIVDESQAGEDAKA